jgi:hypothetical protein
VIVVAVGGLHAVAAVLTAAKALALHETGNAVASMAMTLGTKSCDDAGTAVGAAALGMNGLDLPGKPLIFPGAGPGR